MSWFWFAILAPFFYSVSNYFDKYLIEKRVKQPAILAMFGGFITFLIAIILLAGLHWPIFSWWAMVLIIISGAMFEIALIPWYKSLTYDDASRVAPLYQIIPILVLIFGAIFLKETLNLLQLVAFCLILVGGFALAVKEFSWKAFAIRKSFKYVVLSAILFSIPIVLFRFVVLEVDFWVTLSYEFIGGGLGSLFVYFYLARFLGVKFGKVILQIKPGSWLVIMINELIYLVARLFNFYALSLAPAVLVSIFNSAQPFFMLSLGWVLSVFFPKIIKEDISKKTLKLKFGAIFLIFVGALLMSL